MPQRRSTFWRTFKFDRRIDLGHILTILGVMIAFLAYQGQRRALENKVSDLQNVIDRIEAESYARKELEVRGLEDKARLIMDDANQIGLFTEQIRLLDENTSTHLTELTSWTSDIAAIVVRRLPSLSVEERTMLRSIIELNIGRIEVVNAARHYRATIDSFTSRFDPTKRLEKYKDEPLMTHQEYVDSLDTQIKRALNVLERSIAAPSERSAKIMDQYLKAKDRTIR